MGKIQLRFGPLNPKIAAQLKEQRLSISKGDAAHFEKDREALNRLRIRGLISESAATTGYKRLMDRVAAKVRPLHPHAGDTAGKGE